MQSNQGHSTSLVGVLLSSIVLVTVLAVTAFAEKQPATYPEEGKITATGQNEHSKTSGGGMIMNGNGNMNTHTRTMYSHVYTVQTDTKMYQLDCGKLPAFHSTGGECGGDKKFELGDVIHFRVEKGTAYVSITDGGKPGEQKLRILNEELRPDAKSTDKPEPDKSSKPADPHQPDAKQ
jgi:hypothetical protein